MGKAQVLHAKGWWFKPQRLKSTVQVKAKFSN